jgi:prepilin-type N-terminal cleavage/methylation domain-containing protein
MSLYFLKNKKGFSLVEIIITIFVFSLIIVSVGAFQKDMFSLNGMLSGSLSIQDEARRALKTITAETRSASISNNGAYPISQATDTSFMFYCDVDNDSLKERIRYFLDGVTLKKGTLKPSGSPLSYNPANEKITELVHYMANGATPIFSYYDENYDGTTSPLGTPINIAMIRLLKITLIIDSNSQRPPAPVTFITQVSMRNLKSNL